MNTEDIARTLVHDVFETAMAQDIDIEHYRPILFNSLEAAQEAINQWHTQYGYHWNNPIYSFKEHQ